MSGGIELPSGKTGSAFTQLLGMSQAQAQSASKKKRRSLFKILFGRKKAKRKVVRKKRSRTVKHRDVKRRSVRKRKVRKRKKRIVAKRNLGLHKVVKAVAAPVVIAKLESAKTVLVVGDFFSGGLAKGLKEAYSGVSDIQVIDKSNGLSGFVRDDVVNWPTRLPALLDEFKPAYVVVMLGSNDRQLIRENGDKLKKRTPEWEASYKKRVEALGKILKAGELPYFWVGLPPVRFKTMNKDFLDFNEIYSKAAQSPKGKFVDVWDGFSDADGNYSRSGPDVNGQIVLLRPKDGINLTRAGRRRLAFYVQGQIQNTLSDGKNLAEASLAFDIESQLPKSATYNPERTGKTVVIRLDDPAIDGVESLVGEKVDLNGGAGSVFRLPVINGPARSINKTGRVDDYSWPLTPNTATPNSAVADAN